MTWRTHPARWLALVVGVGLAVLALLSGRPAAALLGVPLILSAVWGGLPDRAPPRLRFDADDNLSLPAVPGVLARVRLACDGHRGVDVLASWAVATLPVELSFARTGPQPLVRADWDCHGPFLLSYAPPGVATSQPRVILPHTIPLGAVPESPRLRGLTGPATSRRPGDGFELRDIHRLRPGESLRRIDWRATARQTDDDLWVTGFYATGEAVAVLVMDSRDEVGPDLHTWSGLLPLRVDEPTSLDLARHAAASIARRLITAGDRVGLADLATGRRVLVPATGRRHLDRLTYALALSAPVGSPRIRVRPPQVPADAIVYLFSTLLDDEPVRLVHALRTVGHRVVVVDTLPEVRPVAETNLEVAWRITAAERRRRIRGLAAQHIPVIGWSAPARAAAASRLEVIRRLWRRPEAR